MVYAFYRYNWYLISSFEHGGDAGGKGRVKGNVIVRKNTEVKFDYLYFTYKMELS